MKSTLSNKSADSAKIKVTVSADELSAIKSQVIKAHAKDVSPPGFRKGKAPESVVEQQLDERHVQSDVLEDAVNTFYIKAVSEHKLKVLDKPEIKIVKFVPYEDLEFEATVDVLPAIKLMDYKKLKVKQEVMKIGDEQVDEVIENLREKSAKKHSVDRPAQSGDELIIDFTGKDKNGKSIAGASGKDYPLLLGSDKFIPGFEKALEGAKKKETKTFDITFPKDYAHKALAGQKATFTVVVKDVKEVIKPELDEKFAKSVGPFETVDLLRADIKVQLEQQFSEKLANQRIDNIMAKIIEGSDVPAPKSLVDEQAKLLLDDFMNNLTYRGMTMEDYLKQGQRSEEEFRKDELIPQAERRVKVGLVLSEIAENENITVSDEEVEIRLTLLKQQYKDPGAQAEFDKPEVQREVRNRLITEKTLNHLAEIVAK